MVDVVESGGNMEMLIMIRIFNKISKCKFNSEGVNMDWSSALVVDERKVLKKFICESGQQFEDLRRVNEFKIDDLCQRIIAVKLSPH